ncbi:hypothetical protein CsSME_00002556 [Camellia sinensis var. sinensis]
MVGIEGIIVGMVGSAVAGSGGRVSLGTVGMVGKDEGIWVLGNGGNVGSTVGIVGKGVFGIVGNGGNATLGREGIEGTVCNRLRAARLIWVLENASTITRDRTKLD